MMRNLAIVGLLICWGFTNAWAFLFEGINKTSQSSLPVLPPSSEITRETIPDKIDPMLFVDALKQIIPELPVIYYKDGRIFIDGDFLYDYVENNPELEEKYKYYPYLLTAVIMDTYPEEFQDYLNIAKSLDLSDEQLIGALVEFSFGSIEVKECILSTIDKAKDFVKRYTEPVESAEIDALEEKFKIDIDDPGNLLSKDNRIKIIEDFLNILADRFPGYLQILEKIEVNPNNSPKYFAHMGGMGSAIMLMGEDFFDADDSFHGAATPWRALKLLFHEFGHIVENALPIRIREEWYGGNEPPRAVSELFAESFAWWVLNGEVCDILKGEDVSSTHELRQNFFNKYFSKGLPF